MQFNWSGLKYLFGPMSVILIPLFDYRIEGFGNVGELEGFDHLGFQEISGILFYCVYY